MPLVDGASFLKPCRGRSSLGIFRIEPNRLDEILYGPVEVALVTPAAAAVDVGVPIIRLELDRLVVRDGPVEVASAVPNVAAVVVRRRIRRIGPHRLVEIHRGVVEVRVASMSSIGLFAPIGEVDMKSAPGPVR